MNTLEEVQMLMDSGFKLQVIVNTEDLKQLFQWFVDKMYATPKEESYLTARETADKLGVDVSTLWRWDKSGYLKKIKLGNTIRYRESDVNRLMNQ